MGKKRSRRARRRSAERTALDVVVPSQEGSSRSGVVLFLRRLASWAVDYVIAAGLVSVFWFCANVFYLEPATVPQGHLMLVCAVVTLLLLTVYLPVRLGGQTLGERLLGLRVVNRNGSPRTYLQCFVRECVLKVVAAPFVAVFCVLDYLVLNIIIHRDADPDLIIDFFCKTRVGTV